MNGRRLEIDWRPPKVALYMFFGQTLKGRTWSAGLRLPAAKVAASADIRLSRCPNQLLIRVGHSPDPDDAFMFHALANRKIDTGRYRFTHELQDIETLNHRALAGELELTAVSLHGYAYVTDKYALCSCGAQRR